MQDTEAPHLERCCAAHLTSPGFPSPPLQKRPCRGLQRCGLARVLPNSCPYFCAAPAWPLVRVAGLTSVTRHAWLCCVHAVHAVCGSMTVFPCHRMPEWRACGRAVASCIHGSALCSLQACRAGWRAASVSAGMASSRAPTARPLVPLHVTPRRPHGQAPELAADLAVMAHPFPLPPPSGLQREGTAWTTAPCIPPSNHP